MHRGRFGDCTSLGAVNPDGRTFAVSHRLFKLPASSASPSSAAAATASHIVTYKGTIPGAADTYELDHQHVFTNGMLFGNWLGVYSMGVGVGTGPDTSSEVYVP